MKTNGTYSDKAHAKCNMHFDPIKLEFTCLNNQKLKVDGIVEKDGELKLRFRTLECPNCPFKKECEKITNIGHYMNLSILFSLKGKTHFFHKKDNKSIH